jgi:hypothetical protein
MITNNLMDQFTNQALIMDKEQETMVHALIGETRRPL